MIQKVRRRTPEIEVMEFTGDNLEKFSEWIQSQGAKCYQPTGADTSGCVIFFGCHLLHIPKGGKVFKAEGHWYCVDEELLRHEFERVNQIDALLPPEVLNTIKETKEEIDALVAKLEHLEVKVKTILGK